MGAVDQEPQGTVPILYLRGCRTGDFQEATLAVLLGRTL
jgi:hypothetical protein